MRWRDTLAVRVVLLSGAELSSDPEGRPRSGMNDGVSVTQFKLRFDVTKLDYVAPIVST